MYDGKKRDSVLVCDKMAITISCRNAVTALLNQNFADFYDVRD
jgi:hypothetical protein